MRKIINIESLSLREKFAQLLIVRQSDLMLHADTAYSTLRRPEEAAEIMKKTVSVVSGYMEMLM